MDDYSTTAAGGLTISRGDRLGDTGERNSYIMVAERLLLLIVLLIAVAYVLYPDRAMRTAPNVAHWQWASKARIISGGRFRCRRATRIGRDSGKTS
jgi:hypothetical protein